jgi:uncharacterized protein with gpF-like domain
MKPKTARAVFPNAGVAARYRKRIENLYDDMANSVLYWLTAEYKKAPPRMAMDVGQNELKKRSIENARESYKRSVTPSAQLKSRMQELAKRWISRFDEQAPIIAESYAVGSFKATDSAMRSALKDAGWTVEFEMTPSMRDALNAHITENVGLIRTIADNYLAKVEGIVMRNYALGGDLHAMTNEIVKVGKVGRKRAAFIARDQNSKANAITTKARRLELGITQAIWLHSTAGAEPRASHVDADGKTFNIAEGKKIDGEYIQPGELINCRCVSRSILPF